MQFHTTKTAAIVSLLAASAALSAQLAVSAGPKDRQVKPKAAVQEDETLNDVKLTNPIVKNGLVMRIRGRKIVIGSGQVEVAGKVIDLPQPTKVVVPPAGPLSVNDDIVRFSDGGKPTDTVLLPKCRAALNDSAILRGILVPGSVKVKGSPGPESPRFINTKDFVIQEDLGAIKALPGGSIKPGDKVFTDYQCWRRRIDTIAFDPTESHFVLVQGVPARSAPEPPEVNAQLIPLANVYSNWGDQAIPKDDVMPISEREYKPSTLMNEHNRKAMAPIIKKLEEGQPVHIVFWGDSVTQGFDARSKKDAFVARFIKGLKTAYPKSNLTVSNLGISGSDSARRLPSMKTEVFTLKPDLIVVEFVNDYGLPSHVLQKNYEALLDEAKDKNVSIILCAPHTPSPRIARAASWEGVADRPFIPILRELANNNDFVALADVFSRWQHLPQEGLRSEILFVNGLNNPNNLGHTIYAEELLRCFGPNKQLASQQQ